MNGTDFFHQGPFLSVSHFLDFLPDPTFAIDNEGRVILWNAALEEISGVKAKDMLGKGNYECSLPFYGTRRPMLVEIVLKGSPETEAKYVSVWRKDDVVYAEGFAFPSRRYLWGKASPIYDGQGRVIGAIESVRDITEYKKTESDLRASTEKYQDIFMHVSDLLYVHDLEGRFTETNLATKKETGYNEEDMRCLNIRDIIPERYRDQYEGYLNRVLEKGYGEGLMTIVTKTGQEIILEYRNSLIVDAKGKPSGIRGSARDITRRIRMKQELLKKHEELQAAYRELEAYGEVLHHNYEELAKSQQALHTSEERFRSIAANLPGVVFQFFAKKDGTMGLYYVNERSKDLLGLRHDLPDFFNTFTSCVAPEHRSSFLSSIQDAIATSGKWIYEGRFIKPGGGEMFFRGIAEPLLDNNELLFNGVLLDITQERRTEEMLEKSNDRFLVAFQASPSAMSISTLLDGRFMEVNGGFLKMSGYEYDEIIGHTALELGLWESPEDRDCLVNALKRGEPVRNMELRLHAKSGDVLICQLSADIIDINKTPCLLMIAEDKTSHKLMERERKMYEMRLTRAQKLEAIGTLAGGIAHDFNNILSAIIGYAELALEDAGQGAPVKADVQEILKAGDRARELVRQILTFSRQTEVERKPLKVQIIAKEALKLLRSSIPSTITIAEHLESAAGPILADPTQIHQVIMNLCTNAYQAMMPRGGSMTVSIGSAHLERHFASLHPPLREGDHLLISVADTGCGMDEETMKRIFDPFFTTKEKAKGTGLGLATVHGIITELGGSVVVKSILGQGSTFDVYIPISAGDTEEEHDTGESVSRGKGESILLVDDEETILQFAANMLGHLGYRVTPVSSGLKALELFSTNPHSFDLVITDQTMPGMTGAELAFEILRARPSTPILLMTGYSEILGPDEALSIGIRRYIEKPFTRSILAREIRRCLEDDPWNGNPG